MKDPIIFVKHINHAIADIKSFVGDCSRQEFLKDRIKHNAVIRQLEIIGEATKNLPKSFTDKYPSIEWAKIARLRDKLIHQYFGVDLELVYDIIEKDLPKLKKEIDNILNESK